MPCRKTPNPHPIKSLIDSFHFIRPWWLLALIPLLLLFRLIIRRHDSIRTWQKVMDPHLLKALTQGQSRQEVVRPATSMAVVLSLCVFALAGPSWDQEPSPFAEDQAALVIVLKVSPSMMEQDIQPSRAERAVQKIQDLLAVRPGARTALVVYAGSAHLVMPLTKDAGIINSFAVDLNPGIMPEDGDDAAAGYAMAEKELQRADAAGSIVFITDSLPDSLDFDGTPVQVLGVVGPDALAPLKQQSASSGARFIEVSIDEADVGRLSDGVETSFAAKPSDQGSHWRDRGWWLTPLIALGALCWFRPGWVIEWG